MSRNLGAVITIREDGRLRDKSTHPDPSNPWLRYKDKGIQFIPNPGWSDEERAELKHYGLLHKGEIAPYEAS